MARVTVTDQPTRVIAASAEENSEHQLRNDGAQPVDFAKSASVVSGAGFQIAAAAEDTVTLAAGEELWGIAPAATSCVIEVL